jgi:hypothetical protein
MQWTKTVLAEVVGLFVDNGSFALAILVWLVFAWWLLPHIDLPTGVKGPILFAGLAAILMESAIRAARK